MRAFPDLVAVSNLLQDNYVLPRFGQVMQAAGKVKRKFAMKAIPDGQPFEIRTLQLTLIDCCLI